MFLVFSHLQYHSCCPMHCHCLIPGQAFCKKKAYFARDTSSSEPNLFCSQWGVRRITLGPLVHQNWFLVCCWSGICFDWDGWPLQSTTFCSQLVTAVCNRWAIGWYLKWRILHVIFQAVSESCFDLCNSTSAPFWPRICNCCWEYNFGKLNNKWIEESILFRLHFQHLLQMLAQSGSKTTAKRQIIRKTQHLYCTWHSVVPITFDCIIPRFRARAQSISVLSTWSSTFFLSKRKCPQHHTETVLSYAITISVPCIKRN